MTEILAIVAAAALFVLYGWLRARRRGSGSGCACGAAFGGCGGCPTQTSHPDEESEHAKR
jgi:hypothetical protein